MAAITPPPVRVLMHRAPSRLRCGDEVAFTLRVGPFRVPWRARIEDVDDGGFTDRQVEGPFAEWVHHHVFRDLGDDTTEVVDVVTYRPHPGPARAAIGLATAVGLRPLFAFRAWRTRRLLAPER